MTVTSPALPVATPARGVTDIADRAVEKIAGRAAAEVADVLPAPRTGLARVTGSAVDPAVDAHVDGTAVRLDIRLSVRYPAPIRTVARRVQHAVRSRVEKLTGLDVTAITVEIVAAPIGRTEPSRVS
jgi:uncharacterized alkaline shock family protein YloU